MIDPIRSGFHYLKKKKKEDHVLSKEEKDPIDRSSKKVIGGDRSFSSHSSLPVSYVDVVDDPFMEDSGGGKKSYKDSVLGTSNGGASAPDSEDEYEERVDAPNGDGAEKIDPEEEEIGVTVVEGKLGTYDCPRFQLTEKEEERIRRPWLNAVIVKLLGRSIGYKALENRLKQMWVRMGVLNIIDLSNGYFLVDFSNKEDQSKALLEGPWLIYDHYLILREWTPNFHPSSGSIKNVAVWVPFSGLPLEY